MGDVFDEVHQEAQTEGFSIPSVGLTGSTRIEPKRVSGGDIFDEVHAEAQQGQQPNDYLAKAEDFIHGLGVGALKNVPFVGKYLGGNYSQAGVVNPGAEQAGELGGRIYEQGLEMAATGGPLREGATSLAAKLPFLGRAAAPLARIGAEALNTGASAALHGQPIGTSAALGAAGAGLSEGLQAVAPKLAESALGVTARLRGHGRTIGEAALGETSAIRPATMTRQAGSKLAALTSELEARADAAGQAGVTGSTKPALDYLDQQISKFQVRNSPLAARLQTIKDQLTQNTYTGEAIPQDLSPRDILELKRGVGDAINTWEPSLKKTVNPMAQRVYSLLDTELDRTVPGAAELNQRISSLIPVKQRANIVSNYASLPQRAAHRVAAHTGALAGAGFGGYAGYERGGLPGAVAGGAAGLLIPEVLSSPSGQMAVARLVRQGFSPAVARAIVAQSQQSQDSVSLYDLLNSK